MTGKPYGTGMYNLVEGLNRAKAQPWRGAFSQKINTRDDEKAKSNGRQLDDQHVVLSH